MVEFILEIIIVIIAISIPHNDNIYKVIIILNRFSRKLYFIIFLLCDYDYIVLLSII